MFSTYEGCHSLETQVYPLGLPWMGFWIFKVLLLLLPGELATGKMHRSVGSSKMADGFQSKAVIPRNLKLVREAEESVTVSTCCGPGRSCVEARNFSHVLPLPILLLSGSTVKLDTTSPSLCCHASAGGGCRGTVGDGLCAASGQVQSLAWMYHWSQVKWMYWTLHWSSWSISVCLVPSFVWAVISSLTYACLPVLLWPYLPSR